MIPPPKPANLPAMKPVTISNEDACLIMDYMDELRDVFMQRVRLLHEVDLDSEGGMVQLSGRRREIAAIYANQIEPLLYTIGRFRLLFPGLHYNRYSMEWENNGG